jgi:hypothetical protein
MNAVKRLHFFLLASCLFQLACSKAHGQTSLASLKAAVKNPEDVARIEQAAPRQALVAPRQPRKLLIFDLNVNYGGHGSIPHANLAFALMGERTGAYQTVVSRDPAMFKPESLKAFDAVFFNNTVGNLFTNAQLRQSLLEFVYAGGGMLGMHGTSVAFTRWPGAAEDWPEFGLMIGGRGANHRESTEQVFVKLDEPDHPLNRVFGGQGFFYRDEFFRVHDPYSRQRVRVVLSMDLERTAANQGRGFGDLTRPDQDYAVAWIRHYGRGRTFYCTIAHNPYVFWDPKMLEFYLGAIQFALGDLPASTVPSAKLTPALRAQEKLGWRLGIEANTVRDGTLFEAIEKSARLGLAYIGGGSAQKLSREIPKDFGPELTDEELKQARLKLDAAGLRLLTYSMPDLPSDAAACRRLFEFGRKMGIETFIAAPSPAALEGIEKFCREYRINLALANQDPKTSPAYGNPESLLQACQGRGPRIGACVDLGAWLRSGIDPVQALVKLKERLLTVRLQDANALGPQGHEIPWGRGAGKTAEVAKTLRALGVQPTFLGVGAADDRLEPGGEMAQSLKFFNDLSRELVK